MAHHESMAGRWAAEKRSAWLYRILARHETDGKHRELFAALARAAEDQARLLRAEAERTGASLPPDAGFQPGARARLVGAIVARLGARRSRPLLAALKVRGLSVFRGAGAGADPVAGGHPLPTSVAEVGGRHARLGSGGNLRAAVFGANDGLVSNASLILGVAGATGDPRLIVTTGVAGLLAGAFSMAAGEYVSVASQRELLEHQLGLERDELELYPEAEAEELALIYEARGVPLGEARKLAATLLSDPERALATLAREELGLNPDELGSPLGAAGSSFLAFAVGAIVPLLPFWLASGPNLLLVVAGLCGGCLFGLGALLALFSGRSALLGGLRMLAIGGAAGGATFGIGRLLDVSVG